MSKRVKPSGYRTALETSAPGYLAKKFRQIKKQAQPVKVTTTMPKVFQLPRR